MRRHRYYMAIAALVLTATFSFASPLLAGEVPGDLRQAVSHMDGWLGKSDQGPGWHRYLRTDDLRAEMAKGDTANRQVVGEIIAKYRSDVKGIGDYHFVDVAKALEAWRAESLLPTAAELPALAQAAAGEFVAKDADDVAATKQQVARTANVLGSWLDRYGDNGQRWKTYLNYSDLEAEMAKDEPDLAKLEGVVHLFASDKNGLEMPKYLDVWNSLRAYIDTYQVANSPQIKTRIEQQAGVLAKLLQELPEKGGFRERDAIGQRLGYFERMGQADELVRAVRRNHSHPNFSGYVSEAVVAAGIDRKVSDSKSGIRDSIMGTSLVIDAETEADVTANIVANDNKAAFDIVLSGVITTDAVGHNRGVTIYSEGKSDVTASKAFYITKNGIDADPATADAKSNNRITGLSARSRFIERIAWRKVGKQKGQAERIGARKTERRVSRQMDEEAEKMLTDSKQRFEDDFRDPLVRRAAFPQVLDFSSTDNALQLTMLQATGKQLGAPTSMAPLAVENDMGVRLHESLINNFASTLYSGRTLTSEEVKKESENSPFMKRFQEKQKAKRAARGEAEPEESAAEERWSITFAKRHPVSVEFQDGGIRFTVRGTRFEGDGPVQERDMSIWAAYKFELADNQGLKLVLQEWDVVPTSVESGGRIKAADEPLRQKLKARFEKIFVNVELDPLELPGQFEKAGQFAYKSVSAGDGWFSLGLDRIPGTGSVEDRVATLPEATDTKQEVQQQ